MPDSYLPGHARRNYHTAFYSEFKKPVLERNKEGEIVFIKVKNPGGTPDSVPVYLFECIQCVPLLGSFYRSYICL
jgi:hypothetical protein